MRTCARCMCAPDVRLHGCVVLPLTANAEAVERMIELAEAWGEDAEGPERLCYLFQHRLVATATVCLGPTACNRCRTASHAFASHAGMPWVTRVSQRCDCRADACDGSLRACACRHACPHFLTKYRYTEAGLKQHGIAALKGMDRSAAQVLGQAEGGLSCVHITRVVTLLLPFHHTGFSLPALGAAPAGRLRGGSGLGRLAGAGEPAMLCHAVPCCAMPPRVARCLCHTMSCSCHAWRDMNLAPQVGLNAPSIATHAHEGACQVAGYWVPSPAPPLAPEQAQALSCPEQTPFIMLQDRS